MNIRYGFWNRASRPARRKPQARRFSLESLESRRLLATLHVNGTTGNDATGDGSAANPYRTITKGITEAVSGADIVSIAAGAYAEAVNINKNLGITAVGAVNATSWTSQPANTATWSGSFAATTDFLFNGPTLIAAATQFTAANVQFLGTLNSALAASPQPLTVNATAIARFGNDAADTVGVAAALASLSVTDGATSIAAANVTTTANQTYNDPVTLTTPSATFTGNDISFLSTLQSTAGTLTAVNTTGGGLTRFALAVGGGGNPLGSLTTNSDGSTSIGGNVTTTGDQSYGDDVLLTAGITTFAGNDIAFLDTLQSNAATVTTVNSTGNGITRFALDVGGGANTLGSLTTNADGTTSIGGNVTTTADQTYNDPVTLTGVSTTFAGNDITFLSTLQSTAGTLTTVTTSGGGLTRFALDVGGAGNPLGSLTTNLDGATSIGGANIITTGDQSYSDPVTLTAATTTFAGNDISFLGTLRSTVATLTTVNTTGNGLTRFVGDVGAGAGNALGSLTTNADGTTTIGGANVVTTGDQTYNDPVTLTAATATFAGNNIRFLSTLQSTAVTATLINTAGNGETRFALAVGGGGNPLGSLTTNADGTTSIGNNVTTTLDQTYNDPVTLTGAASIFAGNDISFLSTLQSTAGTLATVNTTGAGVTRFALAVGGGGNPLGSLTTNGDGATTIDGASVTTSGDQSYGDAVTLTAATATFTGNDIGFLGTLRSTVATVTAVNTTGNGLTRFAADVGGGGAANVLGSLTTNSDGTTSIGAANVITTGDQTYNDNVTLTGATTTFAGNNIRFLGTLLSSATTTTTVNTTGAGVTRFALDVGVGGALGSLTTNADGTTSIGSPNVITTGDQTYNDNVTLTGAATTFAGNDVTFLGTLQSNAGTLTTVNTSGAGLTRFAQDVGGGGSPLGSLTTNPDGTTTINAANVNTTGDQSYGDAVTLTAATATIAGNDIGFLGTLGSTVATNTIVNTTGAGVTRFALDVGFGGGNALGSLTTNADGTTSIGSPNVVTTGDQTYNDPVTLTGASTIFAGNDISFLGTLQSTAGTAATVNTTGNGLTRFAQDVGGAGNPLGSLTTNADGTTSIGGANVITTADQTYNDPVTLTAAATIFAGNDISFLSTLRSTVATLTTVNTTGAGVTRFALDVGGGGAANVLGSLTTNADGTTSIGGNVTTSGDQTYNDPVTLTAVTATFAGNDIRFLNTLRSTVATATTVNTTGNGETRFALDVGFGVGNALGSLTTNADGTTSIGSPNVVTTGDQTYNDPVTLTGAATIFAANDISFLSTLQSTAGTLTTVNTTGNGLTRFALDVGGGGNPLGSLATNADGTTTIAGANVATTGDQTYNDPVTLTAAATTFTGNDISFVNTLQSTGDTITTVDTAGGGTTLFGLEVGGGGNPLGSLTTNADGATAVNGGSVLTILDQTYGDGVTVGAPSTTFESINGSVRFFSTLDADVAGNDIRVNAPVVTFFGGNVGLGNATPPRDLETDAAGRTEFGAISIRTDRHQTYNDPALLRGDVAIESLNGNVIFREFVDAADDGVAGTSQFGLAVDRLQGSTTSIFDKEVGGNNIAGSDPDGLQFVDLLVNGPFFVGVDITTTELIRVQVVEGVPLSNTDDLTVLNPVVLRSLQNIQLLAGDDIDLVEGSSVVAETGTLLIAGDVDNNDDDGTTINILGQTALVAAGTLVHILGGPDDDTLNLEFARFRATDNILVDGAGNSGATFTLVTDGASAADVCNATLVVATTQQTPVGDSLNLFDDGQAGNQVYNLNSVRLARAGGPTFQFLEIQQLDLFAGTGIDQLVATMPSLPSVVRFDGGGSPAGTADQLDIIGSAGADLISVAPIGLAPDRPFQIANVRALRVQAGPGNDTVVNNTNFATSLLQGQAGEDTLIGGVLADVIYGGPDADHLLGFLGEDYLFPDHDFNGTSDGILTIADGDISDGGDPIALPGDAAAALDGTGVAIQDLDLVCSIERLADGGARKDVISWLNAVIVPVQNPSTSPAIPFLINESLALLATVPVNTLPPLQIATDPAVVDNPDFDHWLGNLYQALLGRDFAPAERQYYVNVHAAGASRDDIVQGFLNSPERREAIVASWYDRYLNRALDAGGRSHWLGIWAKSGAEAVEAGILSSNEFFQLVGGTNSAWVDAMYTHVLGRTAGASEKQFWVDKANSSQRQLLSQQFVNSDEHRLLGIGGWYRNYLGRNPETGGAQYWLQKQKTGFKPEKIQSSILTSLEFQKMVW